MLLMMNLNLSFRRLKYGAFQPEGRFQGEQARLLTMQGLCWDAVGGKMGKIGWGVDIIIVLVVIIITANTS